METRIEPPRAQRRHQVRDAMTRHLITVGEDDSVAIARRAMLWSGIHHLPVLRDGALVGILSDRDIVLASTRLGAPNLGPVRVRDVMRRDVRSIGQDETIEDAASAMVAQEIGCLPVVDAGRVYGIVTLTDILADASFGPSAREEPFEGFPTARTLMVSEPLSAMSDEPLLEAVARMTEAGVRHLPVVDGDGRLEGMLSDRDVRTAIGAPGTALRAGVFGSEDWTVADAMVIDPERVELDRPIDEIAEMLADDRIGAVAVVDEGDRLVGIISYVDVLTWLIKPPQGRAH